MRNHLLIGLAAAALTIGSGPAIAANDGAANAGAAKAADAKSDKADKKICKRLKMSNTRMAEKVCLTKSQWEKVEEEI